MSKPQPFYQGVLVLFLFFAFLLKLGVLKEKMIWITSVQSNNKSSYDLMELFFQAGLPWRTHIQIIQHVYNPSIL